MKSLKLLKDTSHLVLKPYELHLGYGNEINMDCVYTTGIGHDEWQIRPDHSGEYKDIIHYTFDAHYALTLIDSGYAVLDHIDETREDGKIEYYLIMRRNY